MKFTFDHDALIKELSIAQEIISTKSPGTILSHILLTAENNTLTIRATDLKVNFETQIPVQVETEGSTTIYCEKFINILTTLGPGEIEFRQDTSDGEGQSIKVNIRPIARKAKFEMNSISNDKFPDFAITADNQYFDVPSKDLKEMIKQTVFAVSNDETRFFMNGVYFDKKEDNLNLVATNGRRLSFASKKVLAGLNDIPSAIVPPKILNIISKHAPMEGNVSIAILDKMIFFKFGNYKFGSVLLEGTFPNYERVIPASQSYSFQVQKSDLVSALKSVATMVDKKEGRLYLNVQPGILRITSEQSDMGNADEEIPCEYAGKPIVIAFNYLYIDEPLRVIDTERITFEFTEALKAVTMRAEPAADYFHIIMPMM